jgi:thiamine transport system ATP-binding protein
MLLSVRGLRVAYGDYIAVDGVDLDVGEGEIVALLGPSGCGKTSVLRSVAGLVNPSAGVITLDGRDLTGVPAHARGVGLMFQDFALFPHRDVAGNVAFGPRMQGVGRAAATARVHEVLDLVGLAGFETRSVASLSGGEQQRVALARALAPSPRLLLLDEPLGSLDRALRERLTAELRTLFVRLGLSVVTVTHDQAEAFTLADRVVVVRAGRVVQSGSPAEVWQHPADGFVARFLGFANVLTVVVRGGSADTPWGPIAAERADGPAVLVIRPYGLRMAAPGAGRAGCASGRAGAASFRGDHFLVPVVLDSGETLEVTIRDAVPGEGAPVAVGLDRAATVLTEV